MIQYIIDNYPNHGAALIGSLVLIFFLIKKEKDKHDTNKKYKGTWSEFFSANWDDFVLAILSGQGLATVQESAFMLISKWFDVSDPVKTYETSELGIAFIFGFSGTFLVGYLYKYIIKKTSSPDEVS